MREIVRSNGLSLALFALFLISIVGQALAGWYARSEKLAIDGQPAPDLLTYLSTGHFLSATFENWESEFLQNDSLRGANGCAHPKRVTRIEESR
jgi:hypothetical protein